MALGHWGQGFKWHWDTGVRVSNGTGPLGSGVQMALGHWGHGLKRHWATGVRGSNGAGPLGSGVQMALGHWGQGFKWHYITDRTTFRFFILSVVKKT